MEAMKSQFVLLCSSNCPGTGRSFSHRRINMNKKRVNRGKEGLPSQGKASQAPFLSKMPHSVHINPLSCTATV